MGLDREPDIHLEMTIKWTWWWVLLHVWCLMITTDKVTVL